MTKLLPCPFCGAVAETDTMRGFIAYNGKPGNATAIYCPDCEADMCLCHGDLPEYSPEQLLEILAERWNRRAEKNLPPPLQPMGMDDWIDSRKRVIRTQENL